MSMIAVDGDEDSSDASLSLLTPVVVVPALLSFGNILKEFPDLLFCILPYIADRVVWNSIASSNRDSYEQSKVILPPWPLYYKLLSYPDRVMTWSPCGTRIAYEVHSSNIAIIDQRRGPFTNKENSNNEFGLLAHEDDYITDLKFSPDGRFLVSAGEDDFIRIWDNITGNYAQLQEWNMKEELVEELNGYSKVSISACSKYIVVSLGNCVFLKDVENGGKTIKSLTPPFIARNENIDDIKFSADGCSVCICSGDRGNAAIKVWCPYLDDDDEDSLIILWKQTDLDRSFRTFTFSNDNTMVAIYEFSRKKGMLWSIDMDHNCLTHKLDFPGIGSHTRVYFTPDNKHLVYNTDTGPKLWSIAGRKFTNKTTHFYKGNTAKYNLAVDSFSPNNRQCIVQESTDDSYITSYFVK